MVIITSLFIYTIAVVFRLLDNSAALLIRQGISVNPFYLKSFAIMEEIEHLEDTKLVQKLHRNLLFQKLHNIFAVVAILTFIGGVIYELYYS